MTGNRNTAFSSVVMRKALAIWAAAFAVLATLVFTPRGAADPWSIAIEDNGYLDLSIDCPGDTSHQLVMSSDLENWEAYTIISKDSSPTVVRLPVSVQSRFLRLRKGSEDISGIVAPSPHPQPRGDRLLGWDILDESPDSDFGENYGLVFDIGADFHSIHLAWSSLEPSGSGDRGGDTFVDPEDSLVAVAEFVTAVRETTGDPFKVSLTLRPIDATGKTVPSDLWTQSFGSETDTRMADRFIRLLKDHVFKTIPPDYLTSLQIGNEIDQYDTSGERDSFWTDYGWFLHHVKRALASDPETMNLPIGFTVTLPGIAHSTEAARAPFVGLGAAVDVIGVTYYGNTKSSWQIAILSKEAILADLRTFTQSFPDRSVYLQELGFQTSPLNLSSEIEQARFFRNFFEAWDILRERIPLVNIVRFNDHSVDAAEAEAVSYQIGPERSDYRNFVEYLRTLGIRTHGNTGRLKPAYRILKIEANSRGWGNGD